MARQITRALHRARRPVLLTCVGAWVIAAVATHIPAPELSGIHVGDRMLHLVGYFVLGSLFWLSLTAYGARARRRLPTVLIVMVVYALVDETTQGLVHRSPEVGDWLANVGGVAAAILVWETVARLLRIGRARLATEAGPAPGHDQAPAEKGPHS